MNGGDNDEEASDRATSQPEVSTDDRSDGYGLLASSTSRRSFVYAMGGAAVGAMGTHTISQQSNDGSDEPVLKAYISQHPDKLTQGRDTAHAKIYVKNVSNQSLVVMTGYSLKLPTGNNLSWSGTWPKSVIGPGETLERHYHWMPTAYAQSGEHHGTVTVATTTVDSLSGNPEMDMSDFAQAHSTDNFFVFDEIIPPLSSAPNPGPFNDGKSGSDSNLLSFAASLLGPTAHGVFEGITQVAENFLKDLSALLSDPIGYAQSMLDGMWKLINNIQSVAENLLDVFIKRFTNQMEEANPHTKGTDAYTAFNTGFVGGMAVTKIVKFYYGGGVSRLRRLFKNVKKLRSTISDIATSKTARQAMTTMAIRMNEAAVSTLRSKIDYIPDDAKDYDDIKRALPDDKAEALEDLTSAMAEYREAMDLDEFRNNRDDWMGLALYVTSKDDDAYLSQDLYGASEGDLVRLTEVDVTGKEGEFDELVVRVDAVGESGKPAKTTVKQIGEVTIGDNDKYAPAGKAQELFNSFEKAKQKGTETVGVDADSFPDDFSDVERTVAGPTSNGYDDRNTVTPTDPDNNREVNVASLGHSRDALKTIWDDFHVTLRNSQGVGLFDKFTTDDVKQAGSAQRSIMNAPAGY